MKKLLKSVQIWQNYGHKSVAPLSCPPLYIRISYYQKSKGVECWQLVYSPFVARYYGFHCDNSTNEDLHAADVDSHN